MNVKELAIALSGIQENRMISYDVVVSALKEGLAKAYRKHIECPDAQVRVEVSDKGEISVFQQRRVWTAILNCHWKKPAKSSLMHR